MANNRKFSVAQATHNFARRLPALGLKLRLFFPIKVNPLNLESQNQFIRTFPWFSRVPHQSKSVKGFICSYWTSKQKNRDYNFIFIQYPVNSIRPSLYLIYNEKTFLLLLNQYVFISSMNAFLKFFWLFECWLIIYL